MIDSISVANFSFNKAMKYLKNRLAAAKEATETRTNQPTSRQFHRISNMQTRRRMRRDSSDERSVTLTFRTLEERLRRLRRAAVLKNAGPSVENAITRKSLNYEEASQKTDHRPFSDQGDSSKDLLIDMKLFFQSIFVFLRAPDPADPPHRIKNRSLRWVIYYRQR